MKVLHCPQEMSCRLQVEIFRKEKETARNTLIHPKGLVLIKKIKINIDWIKPCFHKIEIYIHNQSPNLFWCSHVLLMALSSFCRTTPLSLYRFRNCMYISFLWSFQLIFSSSKTFFLITLFSTSLFPTWQCIFIIKSKC